MSTELVVGTGSWCPWRGWGSGRVEASGPCAEGVHHVFGDPGAPSRAQGSLPSTSRATRVVRGCLPQPVPTGHSGDLHFPWCFPHQVSSGATSATSVRKEDSDQLTLSKHGAPGSSLSLRFCS